MDDGTSVALCPPSENVFPRDTRGTIQHEAGGHGFGKLGDESISINDFISDKKREDVQKMLWRGWYQNLSLSGKLNDVSWSQFIFDTRYSDFVDVFEGGYGYTRGIYRPESNSCMNYGIPYYNTPSRLEIWKRIRQYAGVGWSMDEFYAQDSFEWGPTTVTRSSAQRNQSAGKLSCDQGYAESNRHVPPRVVNFKKMGDEVRSIRNKIKNENNHK
jgi:hypothetical protein